MIPAHDEETRLPTSLRRYAAALRTRYGQAFEIVVIANACSDGTVAAAERLRDELPRLRIVDIAEPIRKGGAVLEGFRLVTAGRCAFVDADGSTDPASLLKLLDALDRADIAIGTRRGPGSLILRRQPLRRRALSRLFNLAVRVLFRLPFRDTQCGAKAFRADAARRLADVVEERDWTFDLDLLLSARRLGFTVIEVPVVWADVEGSQFAARRASGGIAGSLLRLWRRERAAAAASTGGEATPPPPVRDGSPDGEAAGEPPPAARRASITEVAGGQRILALNWRDPHHPEAGGAELNLFEQARRWARDGHAVTVIAARRAGGVVLPEREVIDGVEVRRMGGRFTVYGWAAWYLLTRGHRHDRVLDIANGIPFFAPLFTDRPTALLVHHVHASQWFEEFPPPIAAVGWFLERWIVPLVYRRHLTIAVSPTTRDALISTGFDPDRVRIVYNGVTAQAVAEAERGRETIVYVGRIKRYKRLDRLIRAFAGLRPRFPEARLVIAGDGDARPQLERLAEELGVAESVDFLGVVDEATKARLLAAARVFATPSMQEGWGLSVIEANHHGTPAVAYEVPGLSAAIRQGETGLLARDDDAFREAISRVLDDDALHERLSAGARAWASRFDWDAAARETLEILNPERVPVRPRQDRPMTPIA
ncbi:MAG TPA: glycosyltransferase [Candidatus Dormibacteraeota bacterium]|nr:glycosyltransferase [Candidatus Dormibacteraeota bacterium]